MTIHYDSLNSRNRKLSILKLVQVNDYQKSILSFIWKCYTDNHHWSQSYQIHNEFDPEGDSVRDALKSIGGGLVREFSNGYDSSRYILTPLGAIIATDGVLFEHAVKLLNLLKSKMAIGSFAGEITTDEIKNGIGCSPVDALSLTRFYSLCLPYQLGWSPLEEGGGRINYRDDIDKLRSVTNVEEYIEEIVISNSDLNSPFLDEERKTYEQYVIYSPQKLNLGYDRLIWRKSVFRAKMITIFLGLVLTFIVILAWIPSILQIDAWSNISSGVRTLITLLCALTGIGLFTTPMRLRSKLARRFYSSQTKKAISLGEQGSIDEIMTISNNLEVLWDDTKKSDI